MPPSPSLTPFQEYLIVANKAEYGPKYERLRWITAQQAAQANELRATLLSDLAVGTSTAFKASKYYAGQLSQGCQICGQGTWSCLFINGKCNCRCFFCPSLQDSTDVPTTNTLPFPNVVDYLDYIERFQFRGVGISGGEPLLTLETTLRYIREIRKKFSEQIYLWLYTNGTLLTEETLRQLKDAGLDEIRFDIVATHYDLAKAKMAVGKISYVTVEIPAIPEDFELLKKKIIEMANTGIRFLNLHQLRLTPHNFENLITRDYTFCHGEKVTVLESELTALKLLQFTIAEKIALPINYCSFVYKNRFQKSAVRRRGAALIKKDYEDITENGYIRSLTVSENSEHKDRWQKILLGQNTAPQLWKKVGQIIHFNDQLLPLFQLENAPIKLSYSEAKLLPRLTYQNPFQEYPLPTGQSFFVERSKITEEMELTRTDIERLVDLISGKPLRDPNPQDRRMTFLKYELILTGLQDYF
jgi:uncharacterized protein